MRSSSDSQDGRGESVESPLKPFPLGKYHGAGSRCDKNFFRNVFVPILFAISASISPGSCNMTLSSLNSQVLLLESIYYGLINELVVKY